jgi:hypothetical protein
MHRSLVSTNKRIEIVVVLRGRWCQTVIVNVYAANEDKGVDSKDHSMRIRLGT